MSNIPKRTVLGSDQTEYRYERPEARMLEVFDNHQTARPWLVGLDCTEFTSLCPITGQPDFGRIHIRYVPDLFCIESKSLKLYLFAYRNHGAFHEDCVNQIADHLVERIAPKYLQVFGDFNVRGGIAIKPLAVRSASALSVDDQHHCMALLSQYDALTTVRPSVA